MDYGWAWEDWNWYEIDHIYIHLRRSWNSFCDRNITTLNWQNYISIFYTAFDIVSVDDRDTVIWKQFDDFAEKKKKSANFWLWIGFAFEL